MMPDSPWTMMDRASGRERATRAIRWAWRVSTPYRSTGQALSADPLGTGASLSEAASGEYEPGVPVAVGGQLGVAGVEGPEVVQPCGQTPGDAALNYLDGIRAEGMRESHQMVGDLGEAAASGECSEYFNIQGHDYVSGGLSSSSSECDGYIWASFFRLRSSISGHCFRRSARSAIPALNFASSSSR